jgi:hypothetical protein
MHAKVALLLFRSDKSKEHTLRLIVSTGNWTRQTLEESLDLFWSVDLPFADIRDHAQEHADCLAAWDFMQYVQKLYKPLLPTGLVGAPTYSETAEARDRFIDQLRVLSQKKPRPKCIPRFMDNRKQPFVAQLAEKIAALDNKHGNGNPRRRNYLAMGSGFFEGDSGGMLPSVLEKIEKKLHDAEVLTQKPKTDLIVDPDACQSIAPAWSVIKEQGWTIRRATAPDFFGNSYRKLHAKFLFSARYAETSKRFGAPWVYLGSGNLTKQGFTTKLPGGNLEAGVLFEPEPLFWDEDRKPPEAWVRNVLPLSRSKECILKNQEQLLTSGHGMEEHPAVFYAAPVSLFLWQKEDKVLQALESPETDEVYEVYSVDGHRCPRLPSGIYSWEGGGKPSEVEIRWREKRAMVPVMDEYGRIGARDLQPVQSLSEAWILLAEFPAFPEIDGDGRNPVSEGGDADPDSRSAATPASSYPVRSMMELLEHIAEKQTGLREADWPLWCSRLEMTLVQAADCPEAKTFREWEINPLTPLREACFVPPFAEEEEEYREPYLSALRKAEQAWRVAGKEFMSLGGSNNTRGGK